VRDLLRAETERRRETLHISQQMAALGVVGSSPGIAAVFRWILRASAVSDLPVLIVGETGTGKELAARAIHRLDARRRDKPFVPVNCGAISAGLAESELFGHRRGAFTGADQERQGLVRAAQGGVLFLDEVADLDVALQGKLLRVLQERRVLPVGDDREVPVDIRIVAATNRDLEAMVQTSAFRADLFYRLNVLAMRMPPLRERREDIEPLVQHFVAQATGRAAADPVRTSVEFVQALRRVELPGNVRQLENVVERALAFSHGRSQIDLTDLGPEIQTVGASTNGNEPWFPDEGLDLERYMEGVELTLIKRSLERTQGNKVQAARLLNLKRTTLIEKLKRLERAQPDA
jgi:transcriptional regulator with PAS, ATPase and Fis domain